MSALATCGAPCDLLFDDHFLSSPGLITGVDAAWQSYDRLFTAGRMLFALLSNVSDQNPHSLLHLDSETGVTLSHYVAYSASEEEQMCSDHLLNSPSSLYALCYVRLAPQVYRLQVRPYAMLRLPAWQVMHAPYACYAGNVSWRGSHAVPQRVQTMCAP